MCTAVLGAATGEIGFQSFREPMKTCRLIQSDESTGGRKQTHSEDSLKFGNMEMRPLSKDSSEHLPVMRQGLILPPGFFKKKSEPNLESPNFIVQHLRVHFIHVYCAAVES